MKLAEALQARADLNRRIEQLRARISANAVVQEGEQPGEDPAELLAELDASADALESLISRINLCNSTTLVDGETLTRLIARRDCLTMRLAAYRGLATEASNLARRAARTEIRMLSAVDVKDVQRRADQLARQLRLLDNRIQETNWLTELP